MIDVHDPASPREVGALRTTVSPMRLAVARGGQTLVAADMSGYLDLIDTSDPPHPRYVGALPVDPGVDVQFAAEGDYAYAITIPAAEGDDLPTRELAIFEIADPANLREVGRIPVGIADSFTVNAGYAYLAYRAVRSDDTDSYEPVRLRTIDVHDPSRPTETSVLTLSDPAPSDHPRLLGSTAIAVSGPFAYVASSDDRTVKIEVLSMQDPGHPALIATAPTTLEGLAQLSIAVSVERGYVLDTVGGGVVFDLSDPTHPIEAGRIETYALSARAQGPSLYLFGAISWQDGPCARVDGPTGMCVVDVTDASAPKEVTSLPGFCYDGVVGPDGYAWLACIHSGVQTYRHTTAP
jgi:hypothetical protein